jgi:hypothetical protein
MSFQRVDMWSVICDRCGISAHKDAEYDAYGDQGSAELDAEERDWLIGDGKHWCDNCLVWDEDEDEWVPKPAPIASSPAGAS